MSVFLFAVVLIQLLLGPKQIFAASSVFPFCDRSGPRFNISRCREAIESYKNIVIPAGLSANETYQWIVTEPQTIPSSVACVIADTADACRESKGAIGDASLYFEPSYLVVTPGERAEVRLMIDTDGRDVLGTDAYITYASESAKVSVVTSAELFPAVIQTQTEEGVSVRGIVFDPNGAVSGVGKIATLSIEPVVTDFVIKLTCDTSILESSKIVADDGNASNLIDCDASSNLHILVVEPTPIKELAASESSALANEPEQSGADCPDGAECFDRTAISSSTMDSETQKKNVADKISRVRIAVTLIILLFVLLSVMLGI